MEFPHPYHFPGKPPAAKAEVLPPAPAQPVAPAYSQADIQALLGRVQASPPALQTQILADVKEQGLTEPQQIAGVMAAHFAAADAAAKAQGPLIEQPAAVHPYAGLALPQMPKLQVADMGASTAALANEAVQKSHVAAAPAPADHVGRTA